MALSVENYVDLAHGAINDERDVGLAQVYATLALVQAIQGVQAQLAMPR